MEENPRRREIYRYTYATETRE